MYSETQYFIQGEVGIKVTLVGCREDNVRTNNKLWTYRQEINSVGELVKNRG